MEEPSQDLNDRQHNLLSQTNATMAYERLPLRSWYAALLNDIAGLVVLSVVLGTWAWVIPIVLPHFPKTWLPPFVGGSGGAWFVFLIWCLFFGFSLISLLFSHVKYKSWGVEISDETLSYCQGVLVKRAISMPRNRVQSVELSRGPIQNIFGLSTLTVHSAGMFAPTFTIANLDAQRAAELHHVLGKEIQERELPSSGPRAKAYSRPLAGRSIAERNREALAHSAEVPATIPELPVIQPLEPEIARSDRWYTAPVSESTKNSWKALNETPIEIDPQQQQREQKARMEQIRMAQLRAEQARLRQGGGSTDGESAGGEGAADSTTPVLVPPISSDERQQRRWQHSQWGAVFSEDLAEEPPQQTPWDQGQFLHPEYDAKPVVVKDADGNPILEADELSEEVIADAPLLSPDPELTQDTSEEH